MWTGEAPRRTRVRLPHPWPIECDDLDVVSEEVRQATKNLKRLRIAVEEDERRAPVANASDAQFVPFPRRHQPRVQHHLSRTILVHSLRSQNS